MGVAAALDASEGETERENEVERSRLTMMRRYAEHTGCRRSFLLTYFGQDYPGPCGNCDNDLEHPAPIRRGRAGRERALGRGHGTALRRRPGHSAVRRTRLPRAVRAGRAGTWPAA